MGLPMGPSGPAAQIPQMGFPLHSGLSRT